MKYRFLLLLGALTLLLSACSLAGDVTPPPGYVRPTAAPTASAPQRPESFDLEAGAAIYAERCAACHGETGMGDGPQSAGLGVPVAALGDPAVAGQASLEEWFQVVTEGRMDAMMPPFTSLSEAERWNVVAYAMSLHGKQAAAAATAEAAPSPTAEAVPTDESAAAEETPSAAEETTPAPTEETAPEATETPAAMPESITIAGVVRNGTGGSLPQGLTVTLEAYDPDASGQFNMVYSDETKTLSDGSFVFENVPTAVHRALLARVTYEDVEYMSEPLFLMEDQDIVPLDVTVYETTTDMAKLEVDRWHFFASFPSPDMIEIVEVYVINNAGLRTVVPQPDGTPVLTFTLPEGAQNLRFDSGVLGERFVETENGFGDLQPVPGGQQSQIIVSYDLPYDGKLELERTVNLNVNSMVVLLPEGVEAESPYLNPQGVQNFQGQNFNVYGSQPIPAGGTVTIKISGKDKSQAAAGGSQTNGILLGVFGLGLALIGVGAWMFYRDRRIADEADEDFPADDFESAEEVMDAIIALDEQFQNGKIQKTAYQARRAELKALLKEMME